MYVNVQLLDTPIEPLTYQIPENLKGTVSAGWRVLVPVGRQYRVGIIAEIIDELPNFGKEIRIRKIKDLLDDFPIFPEDLLELCKWTCDYYFYPLGLLLNSVLPEALRKKPKIYYRVKIDPLLYSGKLPEVLKTLSPSKEISRYTLLRRYKLKYSQLDRLEKKGFFERIYKMPVPSPGHKVKRYYTLVKEAHEIEDPKFCDKLLEAFIESKGVLSHDMVKELIGKNCYYWIKKWKQKGFLEEIEKEEDFILESSLFQDILPPKHVQLTGAQEKAFYEVSEAIDEQHFRPFLLYGVTGSGKTEIYLRLCEFVLQKGFSSLVLVPEIALITQVEAIFKGRFGKEVAVWHSGLDSKVRYDQWMAIRKGEKRIVLGTRSSVFTPVQNCKLIIVDEEHDSSYKQEDRLRYSARDVAVIRARMLKAPILLGSATPSIQSYYHAKKGRYKLLILPERIASCGVAGKEAMSSNCMPVVEVVDMRNERYGAIFSVKLKDELTKNIEKGYQSLLFLNRRGYSNCAICPRCGYVVKCKSCSVAMTYHKDGDRLNCHYCGTEQTFPELCPSCEKSVLIRLGYGTEKIEYQVKKLLPDARTIRIDRDSIVNMHDLVDKLNKIRRGEVDIIIGTQMLAKGHDFPLLNLTAIVNADMGFNLPDFRSGEITAQLIFQVSGRPGRTTDLRGKVIIQTYNPGHYVFKALKENDYEIFCARELSSRKTLMYPPFTRMARILCFHRNRELLHRAVYEIAGEIGAKTGKGSTTVIGPAPAPLFRLRNYYRWQFIFKAKTSNDMSNLINNFLTNSKVKYWGQKIQIAVDRDPYLCL